MAVVEEAPGLGSCRGGSRSRLVGMCNLKRPVINNNLQNLGDIKKMIRKHTNISCISFLLSFKTVGKFKMVAGLADIFDTKA